MRNTLFLFFLLSFFVQTHLFAQKGTQSPYSVYGIGEINNGEYAAYMGMGNALTSSTDSTIVNQTNPASYAFISRNRPLFQVGINTKFSQYTQNDVSSNQRQLGLNQFQLGLPIGKHMGASLGLTPYASTGYNIVSNNIEEGDTISQFINEGQGTISKVHLGLAYKKDFSKSSLSVGANANYFFGYSNKIESFEYVTYPDAALHSRVERKTRLSSFNYDFGLLYNQTISENNSFSLGLSYTPSSKLKAYQDLLSYAYSDTYYSNYSYSAELVDTVEYISDNQGYIYYPQAFNIGAEYRILKGANKSVASQLIIRADVKYQEWSQFREEFDGVNFSDTTYTNRLSNSLGFEFTPNVMRGMTGKTAPFLGKVHYRFGMNYTMSEININNTQLTSYGMSFGVGIPVTANKSNTSLNLAVKYGNFGTTDNNLIREQYVGIYFGLTLSPGIYDRWFVKRKYD